MKVAIYHNLTSGGSKRELFEFTREFHRRGYTIDLYRPTTANEDFLPLTEYVRNDRVYPIEPVKRMSGRLPGLRNHLNALGVYRMLQRTNHTAQRIASDIDAEGYDFAFLHHDRVVQSPFVGRHLKCATVYFCAEPMRRFYEPRIQRSSGPRPTLTSRLAKSWYAPSQNALDKAVKRLDRENLAPVDVLVTNSYYSNETIYRAYGRRASVIHLGVDTEKFVPPAGGCKGDYILSVGAVAPLKGYDFLIRSVGLMDDRDRLPVVIVGNTASTSEVDHLRSLAGELGVGLSFEVNVSEEKLVSLYQQAAVYAYTPVMEPMGLSPLEALACGVPVVAVSEGGVRETMQCPGATTLTERFESSFAEALSRVIGQRLAGIPVPDLPRQYILDYWTWPHACERMISALTRVGLISN